MKKVDNDKLDVKKHAGQLFKYFTASKAKFIILTNGIVYKFFSAKYTRQGAFFYF